MHLTDTKRQDMSKLLTGISFTLNGLAPSPFNAAEYKRVLDKVKSAMRAPADRIESILDRYASGATVSREELVDAQPQWREMLPSLRERMLDSHEDDFDAERTAGPRGG